MPRFGLKKEEEVGILLEFSVIWIIAFSGIDFFKSSFDFALLTQILDRLDLFSWEASPHPEPCDSELEGQYASPSSVRHALKQSSFWTVQRSYSSGPVDVSGLCCLRTSHI
jgi:hypothetical protein